MNYPDEIIIAGLMEKVGFNREQAERVLQQYDSAGELDDLISVIEEKENACNRL